MRPRYIALVVLNIAMACVTAISVAVVLGSLLGIVWFWTEQVHLKLQIFFP